MIAQYIDNVILVQYDDANKPLCIGCNKAIAMRGELKTKEVFDILCVSCSIMFERRKKDEVMLQTA